MQKIGAQKNKCPECGHGNLVYARANGNPIFVRIKLVILILFALTATEFC